AARPLRRRLPDGEVSAHPPILWRVFPEQSTDQRRSLAEPSIRIGRRLPMPLATPCPNVFVVVSVDSTARQRPGADVVGPCQCQEPQERRRVVAVDVETRERFEALSLPLAVAVAALPAESRSASELDPVARAAGCMLDLDRTMTAPSSARAVVRKPRRLGGRKHSVERWRSLSGRSDVLEHLGRFTVEPTNLGRRRNLRPAPARRARSARKHSLETFAPARIGGRAGRRRDGALPCEPVSATIVRAQRFRVRRCGVLRSNRRRDSDAVSRRATQPLFPSFRHASLWSRSGKLVATLPRSGRVKQTGATPPAPAHAALAARASARR